MINEQTFLTCGPLVLDGAFNWLTNENGPLSKQELTLICQLPWSEHRRIWNWGLSRAASVGKEGQFIRKTMTRLEDLNLDYFTWQIVGNADLRCSAPDWNLSESESDTVLTYCVAKNTVYVQEWLLQLPIEEHELIMATLQSGTVLTKWSIVCQHWETLSVNGNRLNIADDDPRWQIFFHPEGLIFFLCTEEYKLEKNLGFDQCIKPASELWENIREANFNSFDRCQQWSSEALGFNYSTAECSIS